MQSVYKQLVLGWRIVKQRSGLDPILLSNNKRTKVEFFLWNNSFETGNIPKFSCLRSIIEKNLKYRS